MVSRAVAVVLFAVSFVTLAVAQSPPFGQNGPGLPGSMGGNQSTLSGRRFTSISGSVRSADGQPIGNVRVELRDGGTGSIVTSAYTGVGGNFEFQQVPQGNYDVVASEGAEQAEERVESNSMNSIVDLRLPSTHNNSNANDGMGKSSISVAQYRVPEAAREELRKAREASVKDERDKAQQHLAKALDLAPNYADALTLRAIYKLDARDIDSAIEDLNRAIQNDANCAMAYMALGSAFNMQSKFDDALRTLERAESLAPDAWQAYFEMGRAYAGKNDFEAAVHSLDRAQALAPAEYPLIRLVRANALLGLNKYGDAAAELETYLNKNPNGPDAEQAQRMLARARAAMSSAQK
ncbi:MAG TPA: tetratricopeptide repeat protein [Terriglobales bacterium]